MSEKVVRANMAKSIRSLKAGKGSGEKGKQNAEHIREEMIESAKEPRYDNVIEEDTIIDNDMDFIPALLGEVKELSVTPFGTYALTEKRLLRGVIAFGTASTEGKNKRSFVLDDMTGKMIVETEIEDMPVLPSNVIVIGTFERRGGINNLKAKHVRLISMNETKTVGTWHTIKVIESVNMDINSASRASEILKKSSFLSLIRRSQLNSNQLSLRHVIFALEAYKKTLEIVGKQRNEQEVF